MQMPADRGFNDLTREMGRTLTEIVSPAESAFFDELIDAHELPKKRKKDYALAFGGADEVALAVVLTEIGKVILKGLWTAIQPSVAGIAEDVAGELRAQVAGRLKAWIRGRFSTPVPVHLKDAEIKEILVSAERIASEHGLEQEQVIQIRKIVFSALGGAV